MAAALSEWESGAEGGTLRRLPCKGWSEVVDPTKEIEGK